MKEDMVERNGEKKRWKEREEREEKRERLTIKEESGDGRKKQMQDTKPCRCIRFN